MKSLMVVVAALAFASATALAQTPAAPGTSKPAATPPPPASATKPAADATNPQQERMKVCNEKATGMKGDKRKEYMSTCLSGKDPDAKLTSSQQRMKDCNARAAGKTGDERKKFMSECLKG